MDERRTTAQILPDQVEVVPPWAVLGLRDGQLLAAVRAAIETSGFALADVAVSTAHLLQETAAWRPRLVVAALDVLGAEPVRTIQKMSVGRPATAVVVLSELDAVPVWLFEAGASAVVPPADIGKLKRVLRDLAEQ